MYDFDISNTEDSASDVCWMLDMIGVFLFCFLELLPSLEELSPLPPPPRRHLGWRTMKIPKCKPQ